MKTFPVLLCLLFPMVLLGAELSPTEARDRIDALRGEILRHDELYFRAAAPEISDEGYDRIKQRLAELERAYPQAAKEAALLARIGDDRSGAVPTRRHREPMLSLDKAYSAADLRAFHLRATKVLGHGDLDYVIEPKVDGLAVSVVYERGRLVRAVSRGNGLEGDDITENARHIPGLPPTLSDTPEAPLPAWIELRGEIYVPLAAFAQANVERQQAGEALFANARNLAAGTMRQANPKEVTQRGLRVVFFGMGGCEPFEARPATLRALRATLRGWGLPVLSETWGARGGVELVRAVEALERARGEFAFPTDGAVVKLDAVAQQRELGVSETAPRWAVAYKFTPERAETQVRAITWQVGRTGVLTPVAELEPVVVAGSRIARATLHNADEIERKDVRLGDFVFLEKAGDVIPAIVGVNLSRRTTEARPIGRPAACPSCYTALIRATPDPAWRCLNVDCPAQIVRRIEHYASKAAVDIDGLGPATIEALVGQGWVREVTDLYRLRRADLLSLTRSTERSAERLMAGIENSKRAELWRVIHGLGIPQVGAATAKDLARQCGSLTALAEVGPKAVSVLAEARYQGLIADLISLGVGETDPIAKDVSVSGKNFVLTGTLPHLTRAEATARIERAGGRVSDSVTRTVDYIVVGAEPGAKMERARTLGVPSIDEAELLRLLGGRAESAEVAPGRD